MKKFLIIAITVVLVFMCSCDNTAKDTFNNDAIMSYTVILEDNRYRSYRLNLNSDIKQEIVVKGFHNIRNVKYSNNGFYCFGEKASHNYLLFVSNGLIYDFLLPKDIIEFREIFVYKGLPLFMSVDEQSYNAVFYVVDFTNNKLNTVYETADIPGKYIVVNDKIVLCENSFSVQLQNGQPEQEYGIIKIFDGVLKEVGSGFEPVAYGEDFFLYSKSEAGSINTYCYSLQTETSELLNIHYIDTAYSLEKFEPVVYLPTASNAYYCDENALYCLNTESLIRKKIKDFGDDYFVYYHVDSAECTGDG